jgi:hypothetical protein
MHNYCGDPFSYPVCGENIIKYNCTILLSKLVYGVSACFLAMASPISFLQTVLRLAAAFQDLCVVNLLPIVISF